MASFNYDPTPVPDWFEDAAIYTDVRAVETKIGDVTPAGIIDEWETEPELRLVFLVIKGREYIRGFDTLISVER